LESLNGKTQIKENIPRPVKNVGRIRVFWRGKAQTSVGDRRQKTRKTIKKVDAGRQSLVGKASIKSPRGGPRLNGVDTS